MMKILLVDDERPARELLRALLDDVPGFEVCAEAANGVEALRKAEEHRPDIVLMDIRMPGMDGLEAARYLSQQREAPAVVFVTAYDEHALEAFEASAAGYLLKPIRKEHLEQALANAHKPNRAQLASLESGHSGPKRTHICARMRGNLELIPIGDVFYFQADQKYVTVRHQSGEVIIEEPLKSLECEFEPLFLRIHRNALIAKTHLAGMEKTSMGRFNAVLKHSEARLEISRRHVAQVRRHLKTR